jgi:hypothetical protein
LKERTRRTERKANRNGRSREITIIREARGDDLRSQIDDNMLKRKRGVTNATRERHVNIEL